MSGGYQPGWGGRGGSAAAQAPGGVDADRPQEGEVAAVDLEDGLAGARAWRRPGLGRPCGVSASGSPSAPSRLQSTSR